MDTIRHSSSQSHKCTCFYQKFTYRYITRRQCLFILFFLLIIQLVLFNGSFYMNNFKWTKNMRRTIIYYQTYNNLKVDNSSSDGAVNETAPYKYLLINSTEITMDFTNDSYNWFMSNRKHFLNMGKEESPTYSQETAFCQRNEHLGPITVNKNELELDWVEKQHPDVKQGGYYAPPHCRSPNKVAIIIPYRDREQNLGILLYYLHYLLKKQLLEYRIFVVEQYGKDKWNKGTLFNVAFLESQRFGTWDCLIFHDVDLIPMHEGIIYDCFGSPTHFAVAVENYHYTLPYKEIFGGVTALTPSQYESVNGYSNIYWNWGAEDDDMSLRLRYKNYTILHYNDSVARYASLTHKITARNDNRYIKAYK